MPARFKSVITRWPDAAEPQTEDTPHRLRADHCWVVGKLRDGFVWYAGAVSVMARMRAPRSLSLSAVAVVLSGAVVLLITSDAAFWSLLVTWAFAIPTGVTAMLIIDQAEPLKRSTWLRWLWPDRRGWAPLFRRQLWAPVCVGILFAGIVWFMPTVDSNNTDSTPGKIQALAFAIVVAAAQVGFLLAASKVLHEDGPVPPGPARALITSWVVTGVWIVAIVGPMCAAIAKIQQQPGMVIFGVLLTVPGLFALAVMCRGLQSWDEDESIRHDVAAYTIQGGVILLLLALGMVVSAVFGLAVGAEPDLAAEIVRTLFYGATLLLVPSGWWTLHVIGTSSARRKHHTT